MSGEDLELLQRGEAAGLPGWMLARLRGGSSAGLRRAAARWISDLEAARAHGEELERRLGQAGTAEDPDSELDTRALQERARRTLGREAARRLGPQDPGGALTLLDDTEGQLPLARPLSRAQQRMLELAAREGGQGVLPALTEEELQALHGSRTPEDAMDVIINSNETVEKIRVRFIGIFLKLRGSMRCITNGS